jgi:hypothetical protein
MLHPAVNSSEGALHDRSIHPRALEHATTTVPSGGCL